MSRSPNKAGLRSAVASPILLILGLVILSGVAYAAGGNLPATVTELLVYVVLVVGLQIFIGNSGIVSFGHIVFGLVAAYASTWQTCCSGLKSFYMPGLPAFLLDNSIPVLPAALLAGLVAVLFALVIGVPLMRLSGIASGIALFGVLAMVKAVYETWDGWTAGTSSIIGLPRYVDLPVALGAASAAIVIAFLFRNSRYGLMLRAAREDEVAARAAGIPVVRLRILAHLVSAFVIGIGGVLYVHYIGTISVDVFWLDMTFLTLAMLVVGGLRSVTGAVVGVVLVRLVTELLRLLEDGVGIGGHVLVFPPGSQQAALAIVLLVILLFRPEGLYGSRELTWPIGRPRAGSGKSEETSP
ncbi:branched-chain amino acid ABC transporter permease [Kaistia sp. 32K]|uniref:branched-chain amino acid ABC transporter permease n=1 Tax=Kaistia sp. 32K TaxID=2795690 RepID=UPI00191698E2|nr:branched-chain amino acid ABC transporter permease [Kaistia sp. 32K]BCP52223.1 branched-chain amino acid ABC transporter permease [Kaistia sp. 32K]